MSESMYPQATKALAQKRSELAPGIEAAFRQFSQAVFQDGALPGKTKQLIAVAVAHVTQCPYCIRGPHQGRAPPGGDARGADGGDLGRRGDARGRRLRAFGPCPGDDRRGERPVRPSDERSARSRRRAGPAGSAGPGTADLPGRAGAAVSSRSHGLGAAAAGEQRRRPLGRRDLSPGSGRDRPAARHRGRADRAARAPDAAGDGERLESPPVHQIRGAVGAHPPARLSIAV